MSRPDLHDPSFVAHKVGPGFRLLTVQEFESYRYSWSVDIPDVQFYCYEKWIPLVWKHPPSLRLDGLHKGSTYRIRIPENERRDEELERLTQRVAELERQLAALRTPTPMTRGIFCPSCGKPASMIIGDPPQCPRCYGL